MRYDLPTESRAERLWTVEDGITYTWERSYESSARVWVNQTNGQRAGWASLLERGVHDVHPSIEGVAPLPWTLNMGGAPYEALTDAKRMPVCLDDETLAFIATAVNERYERIVGGEDEPEVMTEEHGERADQLTEAQNTIERVRIVLADLEKASTFSSSASGGLHAAARAIRRVLDDEY